MPALGILGSKVVDITEGNRNINIADQLLASGFQRVNVAGKALQHLHVCFGTADDGILHILLQRGIGVCVGLPRIGSIVVCLHLRRIIERQQRVHFRLPAAIGLIGFVVPLGIDQRVRVCGGGKALDLLLFVRRVCGCRVTDNLARWNLVALLIIQAVHQCLPLRFRGGIGAPCAGGAVVGTRNYITGLHVRWVLHQFPVCVPVVFCMKLFIKHRWISLRDGDEVGDGTLQIRKCLCDTLFRSRT